MQAGVISHDPRFADLSQSAQLVTTVIDWDFAVTKNAVPGGGGTYGYTTYKLRQMMKLGTPEQGDRAARVSDYYASLITAMLFTQPDTRRIFNCIAYASLGGMTPCLDENYNILSIATTYQDGGISTLNQYHPLYKAMEDFITPVRRV